MRKSISYVRVLAMIAFVAALTLAGIGISYNSRHPKAEAATEQDETVVLRIIGTTDLHGQLNSKDYEQGVDYNNGGLARVFDLIQKTRNELPEENTITVDAGDVLFDYTTEYIFSENQNEIQPIYKAMAQIGYDAITLGNHDFDYGYEYILRQLNGSGLRDITVVSNVTDSKTGEYPFLENMLISRQIKTASGKLVEVKVGIIGQTIPVLTAKTHSYAGILKTEDMVANAATQADKLKEIGADIVVAVSHTGIGPENPDLNFKNVAYALTKIPNIDVVVCGHEHNLFPTSDMSSPYYKLPNVDKKTYLMNGKNVIMAGNRGNSIGVVDLTLKVSGEEPSIVGRKSQIRMVTAESTTENSELAKYYGQWENYLLEYSTKNIATMKDGEVLQNYYGLLGDNAAIQLLNDAKIDYASRYVNTTGKSYREYPIIAASTYASYGSKSIQDFISIRDTITESDLSAIQPYNDYLYIYTISGKQLREWLEWTASAYESTMLGKAWSDKTMSELMKETGLQSLIREEWLDDWSNFYIFDGVDYTINPTQAPRYDINGNLINPTYRISSITYNGEPVTDDMVMLLVTNKITKPTDANSGIEKQVVLNGFNRAQTILSDYLYRISKDGSIIPQVDYNWRIKLPSNYRFIVKIPNYADSLFEATTWYNKYLKESNGYKYYVGSFEETQVDVYGPHIVVSPVVTSAINSPYEIIINVTDSSAIKAVKYLHGNYGLDHSGWANLSNVTDNKFIVRKNEVFTVYAEDIHGNKSIYKFNVTNFDDKLLGTPTINTYTNRKTKISGRAEPDATIYFEAYTGVYESKVNTFGTFSYALPAQPSGTEVIVYIRDEKKGLESARVRVPVKRTGPNQPIVNPINNNSSYISGLTNDTDATVIAIIDDKVYVSDINGKELYQKNTEIYDPGLTIVETFVDVYDNGRFLMLLPPQVAGETVTLYNLDHLARNSRAITTVVDDVVPNAPIVYDVSNIDKTLQGYIPGTFDPDYDVCLTIGDNTYTTGINKNGEFAFQFKDQLYVGQKLTVVVIDNKDGVIRISYPLELTVKDIESFVRPKSKTLTLDVVTDSSTLVAGNYLDNGTVYLAIASGSGEFFTSSIVKTETDEDGRFYYELDKAPEIGTTIYTMVKLTSGRILLANKTVVIPGIPAMPTLLKEVTNTDKTVQVIAKKDCELTLIIGTKKYVTSSYEQDLTSGNYIYTFATDRDVSGTVISVTAANAAGTSDVLVSKIVKVAPDQPKVNTVKVGDKQISGKMELLNYTIPAQNNTNQGTPEGNVELPTKFKDAEPKVAETQSRIFAKIGSKTYEGTIDNDGYFIIKIPAQKEGKAIKVWGSNKAGRGPLTKILVVK